MNMRSRKSYQIFLFLLGCILINYVGKLFADRLNLPIWLDSFGTVLTAYALGPVCGAIVGATVNIIYSFHSSTAIWYAITNIVVGITVGICAKKGFFRNIFLVSSTSFLVTLLSVAISTPINYILANGVTGNIWGDGISEMLHNLGWNPVICNIIGEFYLDFLDKVITLLLLYLVIHLVRKYPVSAGKTKTLTLFLVILFSATTLSCPFVKAESIIVGRQIPYDFRQHVQTIYNGENGLTGGSANDIAQTKDGALWIATYSGLYRYNGKDFKWMNEYDSVKSVNCLYTDEAGRLWVGTNDNGLSIFINESISNVLSRDDGLPSDSIRCITEDADGHYYVGTTDSLSILTLSSGLRVTDTIPEITYAESISADDDGNVAVVTNEGVLYLVHDSKVLSRQILSRKGESYNCCTFDQNGILYAGTSDNTVERFRVEDGGLTSLPSVECKGISGINSLNPSNDNAIFICADNGAGYLIGTNYYPIDTGNFSSSIDHMMIDYQENIWFTSSRLGLLRLCPSVFSEIYPDAGLPEKVVNTITSWNGLLYFGTDSGLDVVDKNHKLVKNNPIAKVLDNVRIRCLMTDSKNHLWICTSDLGIWEIKGDKMTNYNNKNGSLGDKFRSVIETKDGTIVVAGDSGITYIKDGKVYRTVGRKEGLTNPRILTLHETNDGVILAGTDGNGIAVIQDGKVMKTITKKDGLSSEIILRIVPNSDENGLFVVTGNGLCYIDSNDTVHQLKNFPYYNNFDLLEGKDGELFVLGSAGIYVVDKKDLLEGNEVSYELLNNKMGLRLGLTANSWNYVDENSNLYMSGDRGVVTMNLNHYSITERSYRMLLREIFIDGERFPVEKGDVINIPKGARKIEFNPEIINYSIHDPEIQVYLDGFDKDAKILPQSELEAISYTNLPAGNYTFHISVRNRKTGNTIAENTYRLTKENEIYDTWWFRLYAGMVAIIIISYLTWLFFRTQIQKTLRMQRLELEWTRKQLQMGNETILTIAQAVDAKDENTSQHSLRVSEYSVIIARKLGYTEEELENLRKIATLHDIGKIGIPDSVLNKPARLTDEEYEIMKSHVLRGADILKNFTLIENVQDGALYHHERYDGRGYVHGLKGEEIPLNARIIGIADAFDAMTANRVYRKKLDLDHVLSELQKGRGTQFDPNLVDILLSLIDDGTIDVGRIYEEVKNKEH